MVAHDVRLQGKDFHSIENIFWDPFKNQSNLSWNKGEYIYIYIYMRTIWHKSLERIFGKGKSEMFQR